jgi:hypothetical protein
MTADRIGSEERLLPLPAEQWGDAEYAADAAPLPDSN